MIPGRALAAFAPRLLSPFPKSVPRFFKALVIVPRTAAIVTPVARKMEVTVTPYFLKIFFTFSSNLSLRESPSASISLSFSISFSSLLISSISFPAFSFSEMSAFSSLMTFSCSFFSWSSSSSLSCLFSSFFWKTSKGIDCPPPSRVYSPAFKLSSCLCRSIRVEICLCALSWAFFFLLGLLFRLL